MNWLKIVFLLGCFFSLMAYAMLPTFDKIEAQFKRDKVTCLHTLVSLSMCDESLIKNDSHIKEFVDKMNDLVFESSVETHYYNINKQEGYSSYNLIKKGNMCAIYCNFDHNKRVVYVDTYSSKIYNPYLTAWFSTHWFKADKCSIDILQRR